MTRTTVERNGRELLKSIGIGDFTATGVIPYLWIAPATTDPKAFPTITIVRHLQQQLNMLGAGLSVTGYVDPSMARCLRLLSGPRWSSLSWSQNIAAVVKAREGNMQLQPARSDMDQAMRPLWESGAPAPAVVMGAGGMSGLDIGLPDVPGGVLTYAVAAFFLYRHFSKRKATP